MRISWHTRLATILVVILALSICCPLAWGAFQWACDMIDHNDGCFSAVLVMLVVIVAACEGVKRHQITYRERG